MAAIDKIYLKGYNRYLLFKDWCSQQPLIYDKYGVEVKLVDYVYKYTEPFDNERPVANLPYYLDAYLIKHCPMEDVQEQLMLNYGHWSQDRIKRFYDDVINWDKNKGECPYWATKEDFITRPDGTMTIKGLNTYSDYMKIKNNQLYNSPTRGDYQYGNHFRCTKHPNILFNKPFACKSWFVTINPPNDYMWYHRRHNSWDFADEFVVDDWSSSAAHVKTIKALKRLLIKWKLPVGTQVTARGRYSFDDYEFIITK